VHCAGELVETEFRTACTARSISARCVRASTPASAIDARRFEVEPVQVLVPSGGGRSPRGAGGARRGPGSSRIIHRPPSSGKKKNGDLPRVDRRHSSSRLDLRELLLVRAGQIAGGTLATRPPTAARRAPFDRFVWPVFEAASTQGAAHRSPRRERLLQQKTNPRSGGSTLYSLVSSANGAGSGPDSRKGVELAARHVFIAIGPS